MAESKKGTAKTTYSKKDIEENKVLAALSYLWILSIVMLLVKKESPYVQFHAKQGLILLIASVIFTIIPVLGWFLDIVVVVFVIIGAIQALSGKAYELPGVASLAKKINL